MASHFQRLPSELLLVVLDDISLSAHATPSLASLCLTSQRLRSLAEPYLYASYSNAKHIDKPHLFPVSLNLRPDLADCVRKIDLGIEAGVNVMSEESFRYLRKAIEETDLPERLAHNWKRHLGSIGMPRAAACAELCLLLASRRVENISLRLSKLNEFPVINHLLFETPNWPGRFDQVRSISLAPSPGTWYLGLYSLAYMFKMPNLRSFEIAACDERQLGKSLGWDDQGRLLSNIGWWDSVKNSGVETIIIRKGSIRHCAVNVLLNCCKAVKHLHVEMDLLRTEWSWFQFVRLEHALCRHAESLERLSIVQDQENKKHQKETGFRDSGSLSFLPRLYNLRSAAVPLRALTAIPDVGSMEVVSSEDNSPSNTFDEASIRKYLPPAPGNISICDNEVHYRVTTHSSGLA